MSIKSALTAIHSEAGLSRYLHEIRSFSRC
ncbi:hypothetical protein M2222_008128 [Bradyrhizobium elkanii]|jgi:hypothetical protein|nr:hypothetical protein [Bradyrhizobium elkanii]MCW2356850.1 hypothetical protein [Bradyrhizobium elkanii]